MKKLMLILALSFSSLFAMSQIDTIYSAGKKIPCNVTEVGADVVKFTYSGEMTTNTLYVNAVEKIIFRSGREQRFAAATSFRKLRGPEDWENVAIASVESEIRGLYKLGEVSSKAKGTTEFSNQERVKMRAMRKLKMDAAMMGSNIVYIYDMRSDGNKVSWSGFGSSSSAETSISGIAYTNQSISEAEVKKVLVKGGGSFHINKMYTLRKGDVEIKSQVVDMAFNFDGVVDESGTTFMQGSIAKVKANRFQVVFVDGHDIYIRFTDKSAVYVYKISV